MCPDFKAKMVSCQSFRWEFGVRSGRGVGPIKNEVWGNCHPHGKCSELNVEICVSQCIMVS